MFCFRFGVQGLPELVLYEVPLIKDAHHADIEEEKISSSSLRTRLLGTLLVPPEVTLAVPLPRAENNHYVKKVMVDAYRTKDMTRCLVRISLGPLSLSSRT